MITAKCEIIGCDGKASVHAINPVRRVCSACADDLNAAKFPRAQAMLEIAAVVGVLRQAADDLETLAGEAPFLEIGTLRRKARSMLAGSLALADGFTIEGDS
jgi:hypothetical protein